MRDRHRHDFLPIGIMTADGSISYDSARERNPLETDIGRKVICGAFGCADTKVIDFDGKYVPGTYELS